MNESAPSLRVVASPHPFSIKTADLELPAGGTVLDLMRAAGCEKALIGNAHVFITDKAMNKDINYIPRENWARVRPKPGTHLSIRVVPGKGGGGGKNPLRVILSIAVIAASFGVNAWIGAQPWAQGFSFFGGKFNLLGALGGAATPVLSPVLANARRAPQG